MAKECVHERIVAQSTSTGIASSPDDGVERKREKKKRESVRERDREIDVENSGIVLIYLRTEEAREDEVARAWNFE